MGSLPNLNQSSDVNISVPLIATPLIATPLVPTSLISTPSHPVAPQDNSSTKQPRTILHEPAPANHTVFAFPPNRETLGGTAYLIVEEVNILVDCPSWNADNQAFLAAQGGVDWLFITHRGGMGNVRAIQAAWNCPIVVQEQEAYLLPGLPLTPFHRDLTLSAQSRVFWTPGHSPGSACLYHQGFGGVLFSGRHLLPSSEGGVGPLRTSKTFHWPRQQQSVQRLLAEFTPDTLQKICPGAYTGFLRRRGFVEAAYEQLRASSE